MPITLVIADDHPLILDAMENLFRLEKDLKVVARCLEGDAALKAVRRHKPDILVLDIQMPGGTGLVALKQLKASTKTFGIPVVVLTAASDPELLDRAKEGGAHAVLRKPADASAVLEALREAARP